MTIAFNVRRSKIRPCVQMHAMQLTRVLFSYFRIRDPNHLDCRSVRSPILDGDDEHSTQKCQHHHRDRLRTLARRTHAGFIRRRSTLLVREVTKEWELGLRLGDAPFHDDISSALGVRSRSERHDQQSHKHCGREHICSFHFSTLPVVGSRAIGDRRKAIGKNNHTLLDRGPMSAGGSRDRRQLLRCWSICWP